MLRIKLACICSLSSCCPPVDAAEYNFNVNEWDCIFLELETLFNQALKKAGDVLHVKICSNDYSKIPASGDEIKIRPPGSRKFVLVSVLQLNKHVAQVKFDDQLVHEYSLKK